MTKDSYSSLAVAHPAAPLGHVAIELHVKSALVLKRENRSWHTRSDLRILTRSWVLLEILRRTEE